MILKEGNETQCFFISMRYLVNYGLQTLQSPLSVVQTLEEQNYGEFVQYEKRPNRKNPLQVQPGDQRRKRQSGKIQNMKYERKYPYHSRM